MECMIRAAAVFTILWPLVYCQTYPYISFMGQTLANYSYVDFSTVRNNANGVQCHTDLNTCCSSGQGPHRGDWFFPNGTKLPFENCSVCEGRTIKRVALYVRSATTSVFGIFCCEIPTNANHHVMDISVRDKVCVGLYKHSQGN